MVNIPPNSLTHHRFLAPLIPIAASILVFVAGEGAARCLIWLKFGDAKRGTAERLDFAPYLMTLGQPERLEPSLPKRPGTRRVLLLGSSTAAQFTREELERGFAPHLGTVEVYNYAQPGYIINQEVVMLALYGLQTVPNLVVSLDGVMDLVAMTKTGLPDAPYVSEQIGSAVRNPAQFALTRFVSGSQLINSFRKLQERREELKRQNDEELINATVNNYVAGVAKLSILSRGVGARHVAILQPYLHLRRRGPPTEAHLSENYGYRREFMSRTLRRMEARMAASQLPGATFLSSFDFCDEDGSLQCFKDEAHLTKMGRTRLLAFVVEHLRAHGITL